MQIVLGIKETLQKIYRKYDIYIIPFMKFLTALIVFMSINGQLGYMEKANNMIIVLVLALLCSFLPSNTVLLFSTALVLAHFYAHSLPVFITGGGMVLILMIAYFGIAPREGYALMLTPIAFACHLPGFVPLAFGLLGGPVSAIGVAIGTLLYYVIDAFPDCSRLQQAQIRWM